jgi:hypothetical protein
LKRRLSSPATGNGALEEKHFGRQNDCHKKYNRVYCNCSTMMFSFAMQATMTALLATTFTIPMQRASHQTACRPVWNEEASPCHYQPVFGAIGTASFFDEDDLLPEDEPQQRNGEGKFEMIVLVSRERSSLGSSLH